MTEQKQIPDLSGVLPLIDESYEQILLSIQDELQNLQGSWEKTVSSSLDIYTRNCNALCHKKCADLQTKKSVQ